MKFISVHVTCKDLPQARKMADEILKARLAACANLIPRIESRYWWQGKRCRDSETLVIFKTRASLFKKLEAAVRNLHTYETPCIVALPIRKGHKPFLKWIGQETR